MALVDGACCLEQRWRKSGAAVLASCHGIQEPSGGEQIDSISEHPVDLDDHRIGNDQVAAGSSDESPRELVERIRSARGRYQRRRVSDDRHVEAPP